MNFFQFLDSIFITKNIENQKDYRVSAEGEMHATQFWIETQKTFYKWVMVPKLLVQFVLLKLHVISPPKSKEELIEGLKKEAEEKKAAREAAKLTAVPDATNPA